MYDTSKNPLLETITLTDAFSGTLNETVTRELSYMTRSLTFTNSLSTPINVYTERENQYYVTIAAGATKEVDVSTDYYRLQAVGTPAAANVTVDILRSSIADSPTNAPNAGQSLTDNAPIDARTEPYRNIVQFDLNSETAYNDIVTKYPDAWNAYYETGAAPAYTYANALKLQDALSFWLYMNADYYIDSAGNLVPPETTHQNTAATDYNFDPYNVEPGTGIGTLENPQIFFDPTAYENTVDSLFSGAGLNDLSVDTILTYNSTLANTRYAIRIDSVGASDTFAWSDNGGVTWTTGVTITGVSQTLSNSLSVTFGAVTGHTLNDTWHFNYRVSQAGLAAPFSKTVPRVTMDGTRTIGSISSSGRNVADSALFSASYLALTEYQAVRQNGVKGPYDWGSPYATGKKTY